jgi:ABC-type amino acid transport substrate-binding protein
MMWAVRLNERPRAYKGRYMPERLFGYLIRSRQDIADRLEALKAGRVQILATDQSPAIDLTPTVREQLVRDLAEVEALMKIYGLPAGRRQGSPLIFGTGGPLPNQPE